MSNHRRPPKPVPSTRPRKKAMDYAADADWPGYFTAIAGSPARETLLTALQFFERDDARPGVRPPRTRTALDLGCGEGRDTRELLRRPGPVRWQVVAHDGSAEGLDLLTRSLTPAERRRIRTVQAYMEDIPSRFRAGLPAPAIAARPRIAQFDLVNASFVIPFCKPRAFPALWSWITARIAPGGRFAGQLFGDRDTWAHVRRTTGIPRARLDRLFSGFILEQLREDETDGVTTMGEPKHWHVYHIVARAVARP